MHICRAAFRMSEILTLVACSGGAPGDAASGAAQGEQIVITEIMANPRAVSDARGEWFEVHNPGATPVNLRGWTIGSRGDAPQTIAASVPVAPGGYAILANNGDAATNGGVKVAYEYGGTLSLNNSTTDALWIANRAGMTVDSVVWGTSSPPNGSSRALADPSLDNLTMSGAGSHWFTSTQTFGAGDRGTPGAPSGTAPAGATDTATRTAARARAIYRNHLEFGVPVDGTPADDYRLDRPQYSLSYNAKRGGPNWASWNLNRTHFGTAERCDCFAVDTQLPAGMVRIGSSDYVGSGYSRGHMVMSEERTATDADNASTFLMTNILPQRQDLNGGPWGKFEIYTNDLAREKNRELYVIAGGTYAANPPTLNGAGRVAIPATTWKIVVVMNAGEGLADVHRPSDLRVIAVDMPNVTGIADNGWTQYRTTVDAIEAATGYDFLDLLPDSIEEAVESRR